MVPLKLLGLWTPHAGRTLRPSCGKALGFKKDEVIVTMDDLKADFHSFNLVAHEDTSSCSETITLGARLGQVVKSTTLTIIGPVGDVFVCRRRPMPSRGMSNMYVDIASSLAVRSKEPASNTRNQNIETCGVSL